MYNRPKKLNTKLYVILNDNTLKPYVVSNRTDSSCFPGVLDWGIFATMETWMQMGQTFWSAIKRIF